jgi:hypothetical protein
MVVIPSQEVFDHMTESTEQKPKQVLSLKEFLAQPKDKRPKILLEKEVFLETEDIKLTLTVRQLTKAQYEIFNKRIQGESPQIPLVDVLYTQAHRDPSNPNKIRPAGTYKERDEKDPNYQKEVGEWFTSSCIMLAVFSAAESLGINPDDLDAVNDTYRDLSFDMPGPSLLEFAVGAAEVNPGVSIAEELMKQEMLRRQQIEAERQIAEAERLEREQEEEEHRAAIADLERRMKGEAPPEVVAAVEATMEHTAPPVIGVEAKEMILALMPESPGAPDEV